jgi:hypothetical protein
VARDFVKVPVELLKLHKEVYITANLFFVNKIPFFLMLSHKICFMAINHLADRNVPQIFKAFKEIYQYYLQRGFCMTMVHADGEFAPLKILIESLPGGPFINLASPDEHVPEIQWRIWVVKEQSQAAHHSLPFQRIPKLLMIHIVLKCHQDTQFLPNEGRNFRHSEPKDHHVWRDSQLQETLESPSWTLLSGARGRYPTQ